MRIINKHGSQCSWSSSVLQACENLAAPSLMSAPKPVFFFSSCAQDYLPKCSGNFIERVLVGRGKLQTCILYFLAGLSDQARLLARWYNLLLMRAESSALSWYLKFRMMVWEMGRIVLKMRWGKRCCVHYLILVHLFVNLGSNNCYI